MITVSVYELLKHSLKCILWGIPLKSDGWHNSKICIPQTTLQEQYSAHALFSSCKDSVCKTIVFLARTVHVQLYLTENA